MVPLLQLRPVLLTASVVLATGCGDPAPRSTPVAPPSAPPGGAAATGEEARGPVVDVAGEVRRPGVYRMPDGARVHEAIAAAGGTTRRADLTSLNRAAPVVDGQQVLVPRLGEVAAASDGSGVGVGGTATTVSLNAADLAQLDSLPGIGPVTAQRILDERSTGGPFGSVDDLDRVPGIGPATIESLRDVVTA